MTIKKNTGLNVLYIPHGGGPLPLLDHKGHLELIEFLKEIPEQLEPPDAIIIVSAHWEQSIPTLTASASPPLIYDYYGFAPEAYEIDYPAPGAPRIAEKLLSILEQHKIHAQLDKRWGFDHGMFVPLKLMYPDARIPCIQLSLINGLDPLQHIKLGCALRALRDEKILVLGSGFSFHNMKTFGETGKDPKNIEFDQWLVKTMTDPLLSPSDRQDRLVNWENAPHARYCHPREEHLLPLHVCYGITEMPARLVFHGSVLGKKSCAFLWQ
ncbi:LigB [Desulforapulum autotrophicum HRM2]|uniref:LigB n=1 Tax=Desulforapulum autotrophicum (strain ATCC 43914 / DSM 3382 / VKM B-1955 / HRM2) TaxID=177437 RepID=C0QBM2_DESAH|nr:class III extradiol ring-cleavage dioxygenase [Desulforapulum autotrophicum]ACN17024.1 LigB [Desulforapulum autotrophicum HRM2]